MMVVVAYDVKTETKAGARRLRRVAKLCQDHGQRVQFSVFECLLEPHHWTSFRAKLLKEINPKEDSLRFYLLGRNWKKRLDHVGAKQGYDPEGLLML